MGGGDREAGRRCDPGPAARWDVCCAGVPGSPTASLRLLRGLGRAAAGGVLMLGLLCGCREAEDSAVQQSVREASVTAEVRSRILTVNELKPLPITVDTRGGTVTIGGTVSDSSQVAAVRSIAERVRGVERVDLHLRVVPPPDTTRAVPPSTKRRPRPEPQAPEESLPSLDEAG